MSTIPMKYQKIKSSRWGFFDKLDISSWLDPTKVHFRRLRIIQTPWFGLYVHRTYEADIHRDPHDHPWKFWSLIVKGWYVEEVFDSLGSEPRRQLWRRGSIHHMPLDKAHKITDVSTSVISLLLVGPRVRAWKFWTDEGFVAWPEYLKRRPQAVPPV